MTSIAASLRPDRLVSCFINQFIKYKSPANRVPILMYHSISWEQDRRVFPYYSTNTFPSVFEEHVRFLVSNKYQAVGEQDLLAGTPSGPGKYVLLTFDDGYLDFYTYAFPILRKYGLPATVFLPTAYIGTRRKSFQGRQCLDWEQVRELSENGIDFGSHSHSHLKLSDLSPEEIETELKVSKETIENETGKQVISFSYPFAFPEGKKEFIHMLKSILARLGFRIGVTTQIGLNGPGADPLTLRRIPANSFDDRRLLAAKIEGAYDWLNLFQKVFKHIRNSGYLSFNRQS